MAIHERVFVIGICMHICLLTEGIEYLGCYEEKECWLNCDRVLEVRLENSDKNTPEDCASRCSNYKYAGVESSNECFCGNRLENLPKMQESECSHTCPGNISEKCGGHWRISVYTNWGTQSIAITPPSSTTTTVKTTGTTNTSRVTFPTSTPKSTAKPETSSITTRSATTAVAAGVSVTVAIAVSAVVIVLVLRNRKKLCFENTKRSNLENRDDDNHISLQNDLYQAPGAPMINHTNSGQPNFGVSTNEVHPYFVLEKGDQPVHNRLPNEANPYFVLEKQITGNPPPIHTANALALEDTDGDMYQGIVTDDTYAGIDDSRDDNNDYDNTNKSFNDSRTEISDNVYNHLNVAGDEYDHLGKGQSNDEAMENNYDITSSAIRK